MLRFSYTGLVFKCRFSTWLTESPKQLGGGSQLFHSQSWFCPTFREYGLVSSNAKYFYASKKKWVIYQIMKDVVRHSYSLHTICDHHTIWSILISSNLPFMEQYLKLNYIPNKKCSAGQSWSVCNKASLLLKNTLYGHMKTLMKISTQENNPVTFPFRFKIITAKINLSILFYFHPRTERNWHSN